MCIYTFTRSLLCVNFKLTNSNISRTSWRYFPVQPSTILANYQVRMYPPREELRCPVGHQNGAALAKVHSLTRSMGRCQEELEQKPEAPRRSWQIVSIQKFGQTDHDYETLQTKIICAVTSILSSSSSVMIQFRPCSIHILCTSNYFRHLESLQYHCDSQEVQAIIYKCGFLFREGIQNRVRIQIEDCKSLLKRQL